MQSSRQIFTPSWVRALALVLVAAGAFSIGARAKGAQAKTMPGKERPVLESVQSIVRTYNRSSGVKMKVKKTSELALLNETRRSEGGLFFSKGQLRLELKKPEETTVVYNSSGIWVETVTEGFDGPSAHVMKITSKELRKQAKAPLAFLLKDPAAWNRFNVAKTEKQDDGTVVTLKPKKAADLPEIKTLIVGFDQKKKTLLKISYSDEMDNVVTYSFSETEFDQKFATGRFNYQPPKGAEVVNF
jgi:outer membrane lipoprotein-sorting protein